MKLYDLELAFLRAAANSRKCCVTTTAKQLGVSRETLSRVLHGHRPSLRLLRRFLEITNPSTP